MTREEAKEILTHNWTRVDNPNYSESELDEAFFMAIEALSADAVEVVRCKGCKHYSVEGETTQFGWCNALEMPTDPDGYCYLGERREESEVEE